MVDPYGEMLEASWEGYATLFANAKDEDALLETIRRVVSSTKLDLNAKAVVIQARDTRCPSQRIVTHDKTFWNSIIASID